MKEDRMLTDIELENVAGGTEELDRHSYNVVAIVCNTLYDLWERLKNTYTGASEIRKMAECCETIMNDYSTKSKMIENMKWYCKMALKSDVPTSFALIAEDQMNILIKEIGE